MKLFYTIVLLCFLTQGYSVAAISQNNVSNLVKSIYTILKSISQEFGNNVPKPETLLKVPIQAIVALPESRSLQTVSQLSSIFLPGYVVDSRFTPNMESMTLRLRTPCEKISIPLSKAEDLLQRPEFDVNKKVAIFVPGSWSSGSERNSIIDMAQAFACRGDYNFMTLSSSDPIQTIFTWSGYNTEIVGQYLARALEKLVGKVPLENIHLIGHSMGAHIVGYAGRHFSESSGLQLKRITGLDPAKPIYNEGESLSGIQRGDAEFVDVIHTNPGVLGERNPVGDVDFYVEGLSPVKPGCYNFGCSHSRALKVFIESVYPGNENNFLSVRCSSLTKVNDGSCNGPASPMGLSAPSTLKGSYMLSINAQSPYGKNNEGRPGIPSQCEKCNIEM